MTIKNINIKELKPYKNNPRKNDEAVEYVAESIREFGFKVPLVIDKDNTIVCGHTRYKAAKKLGINELPCVVADDLTEDQIKAFRLADNKVGEMAEWDFELLDAELEGIELDMEDFGFEYSEEKEEPPEEDESYYGDERERTFNAYNLYDIDPERLTEHGMPILERCDYVPQGEFASFNYARTEEDKSKTIHFYIDDYQFERIWNAPKENIDILEEFDCILTPDFSLYTEMPLPMQIWNIFRSKLIGQMCQRRGMNVIPTLQWCYPNSYQYAFDGIEPGGVVSVSTIGVKESEDAKEIWFNGMAEAMKIIKPKAVIVYGGDIGFDFGKVKVIYINNNNAERLKNGEN